MSVYGLSVSNGKTAFNVHLSSLQTTSYMGSIYDAVYDVNLRGHLDVSDFQKEYNVYIALESQAITDLTTATGINPLETYAIHMDFGANFINTACFRERSTPDFIAFQQQWHHAPNMYNRFSVGSSDNPPLRVKTLYNVGQIGFNIFPASVAGQTPLGNTSANYQIILRFEEA